jgi:hypothetical protein
MNQLNNLHVVTAAALFLEKGEPDLTRVISLSGKPLGVSVRETTGEALISLGKRIKPATTGRAGLKHEWQGR